MVRRKVLFLTWDGPQTSYLQSLFGPVFRALAEEGWEFQVIQVTWADEEQIAQIESDCQLMGIRYSAVSVVRNLRGFGQILGVLAAIRSLRRTLDAETVDVVIFRSIMGAVILKLSFLKKAVALIYDSDGLPVDERIEFGGMAHRSALNLILRKFERWALKSASVTLARSKFGRNELLKRTPSNFDVSRIHVVSNGRDQSSFRGWSRGSAHTGAHLPELRLCYLGSWGAAYRPFEILSISRALKQKYGNVSLEIFTGDKDSALRDVEYFGFGGEDWISVSRLHPSDVATQLNLCDVGFAFRVPTISTKATAPIKLGDYMSAGIPVIGDDIGDLAEILVAGGVLMVPEEDSLDRTIAWVLEDVIPKRREYFERCREFAVIHLNLQKTTLEYHRALTEAVRRNLGS